MREVQPFKQRFWSNWAPKDREQQKQTKTKLKKQTAKTKTKLKKEPLALSFVLSKN